MEPAEAEITGMLLDPKRFAVHDGPGIRTTFVFKGCPLRCLWCHNPEGISLAPQLAYYEHRCIQCGECATVCPTGAHAMRTGNHVFDPAQCITCGACEKTCLGDALKVYGKRTTVAEAMAAALEDRAFYAESGGGVTLFGGEPLTQPAFALAFLTTLKRAGLHTALDTCAFVSREALRATLPWTDLYLVDFKHADPNAHRRLTGQSNEVILENLRFLSDRGAEIEIRLPLIPGLNDAEEALDAAGRFLGALRLRRVKVLPYHALARTKYKALSMPDTLPRVGAPSPEDVFRVKAILEKHGLNVCSAHDKQRNDTP